MTIVSQFRKKECQLNERGKKKISKQHLVEDLESIHQMGLFGEAPKGNGKNIQDQVCTMPCC
jgi:hypothetical protein